MGGSHRPGGSLPHLIEVITGLREAGTWSAPDAALPVPKKTHQGREGSALPKPY